MTVLNFIASIAGEIRTFWRPIGIFSVFLAIEFLLTACGSPLASQFEVVNGFLESMRGAYGLLRVIAILPGLALLFMGRKIYNAAVALPGFMLGAILGAYLGHHAIGKLDLTLPGFAIGGLLGVWVGATLHNVAVFVIGAVGGVYIVANLWELIFKLPASLWVVIIAGIVGGLVMFIISKRWVIILSSAVGATMITWAVGSNVVFVFFLFIVGVAFQYTLARIRGERPFAWPGRLGG